MVKYFLVKTGNDYRIILTGVNNREAWAKVIIAEFDTYSEAELEFHIRRSL